MLEEIASAWMSVAVDVSVHTLSASALARFGTDEQRARWLPGMLGGDQLGAYALSEPQAGSDVSAIATKAIRDGDDYVVTGTKAWISHGPHADFWLLFARTGADPTARPVGVPRARRHPGVTLRRAGEEDGHDRLDDDAGDLRRRPAAGRPAASATRAQGMAIALSALDSGRLGIAACATGLAQGALDLAVGYASERQQFGQPIAEFQGLQFLLADMAAAVESARATYLHGGAAARRRPAVQPRRRRSPSWWRPTPR